ncbi:DUF262 domain-containing protein [Flavobacterium sp. TBRC 19031]|uniref:DUF262 domain-containing protein n=1 Tax=Flavobacterium mekongense TaxID=3379707 RepID=UPI00399A0B0D
MNVNPIYNAVGNFFEHKPMFRVPKYQRSYAWDKSELEDFIKDVENAYFKRKNGNPINHFFGGIVSVSQIVPGAVNQNEFELVDGQQRMATFVLFIAAIISVYEKLLLEAKSNQDIQNEKIIEGRIAELKLRFVEFEQEIQRKTETVEVLKLSRADEDLFKDLIRQRNISPIRESHKRISSAYEDLKAKVSQLSGSGNMATRLDNMEIFKQLMDGDFSIIHIITDNKLEAYTLFRVLNDRGKSLTDGDLLRASTLEWLEGFPSHQNRIELLWDEILKDSPNITEEYLRWIYASIKGVRPGNFSLYDDYVQNFYCFTGGHINAAFADQVLRHTQSLLKEVENCRKLLQYSEWPFIIQTPITPWDLDRQKLLLRELGLKVTMPLLLAACHTDQFRYSEIVQLLEKFLFRYKIIGNQHITPVQNLINTESLVIRTNFQTYNVNSLRLQLSTLQSSKIDNDLFKSLLDNLNYKEGGGNQPIKYFLMTLEHYWRWYQNGAIGQPVCNDKTRIYTFSDTTIEHVYPRNAHGCVVDNTLEPLKNSIENLTFMGPTDNHNGGNSNFVTKKPIFLQSSVHMNVRIGSYSAWDTNTLQKRKSELQDMACKVFNIT